jgi:hypothetical protein
MIDTWHYNTALFACLAIMTPLAMIDLFIHYKKGNTLSGYVDSWRDNIRGIWK